MSIRHPGVVQCSSQAEGVTVVRIDRPEARTALNAAVRQQLAFQRPFDSRDQQEGAAFLKKTPGQFPGGMNHDT